MNQVAIFDGIPMTKETPRKFGQRVYKEVMTVDLDLDDYSQETQLAIQNLQAPGIEGMELAFSGLPLYLIVQQFVSRRVVYGVGGVAMLVGLADFMLGWGESMVDHASVQEMVQEEDMRRWEAENQSSRYQYFEEQLEEVKLKILRENMSMIGDEPEPDDKPPPNWVPLDVLYEFKFRGRVLTVIPPILLIIFLLFRRKRKHDR